MPGWTSQAGASVQSSTPSGIAAHPGMSVLRQSLPQTTDKKTGAFGSDDMSVEVALEPRNQSALSTELSGIYNQRSPQYRHFLSAGAFDKQYAPSTARHEAVANYLHNAGLTVQQSSSPFLVRAVGSSARVSAAFHTTLTNYRDPEGIRYFSNSTALELPTAVASDVQGVVGLTNTIRPQNSFLPVKDATRAVAVGSAAAARRAAKCHIPGWRNLSTGGCQCRAGNQFRPGTAADQAARA